MTEFVITKLGHLGDGLAGRLVVPGTLPGERVEGVLDGDRVEEPRILQPSADRVRPPCPHAKSCGGCVVQHASDPLVADWKRGMVVEALAAQGIAAEVGAPVTSPPQSRRRAGFAGRRTKKAALVGFHGRRSHTLVEVPDCHVITKSLAARRPRRAELTEAGGARKGELLFQVTDTPAGADVAVTGGKPLDPATYQRLVEIGSAAGLARLSWEGEQVAQWQPPGVRFGPARVVLPPGAFLQATAEGESALLAAVRAITGDAARIADLFSGCGTFALPLATGAEVLAVEGDPAQTAALLTAARACDALHPVAAETRDLFRRPLLPDELNRFDAVVIDPPRAGAEAQMRELARSAVARIASVSCSPASFARDAAILIAGGYRMGPVAVVDQFRWSPHVELAAGFFRDTA